MLQFPIVKIFQKNILIEKFVPSHHFEITCSVALSFLKTISC